MNGDGCPVTLPGYLPPVARALSPRERRLVELGERIGEAARRRDVDRVFILARRVAFEEAEPAEVVTIAKPCS